MRTLLMPNFTKLQTPKVLEDACEILGRLGFEVVASPQDVLLLREQGIITVEMGEGAPAQIAADCDFILAIGGDGTIIHSARTAAAANKPVVGINAGRLGFLAQLEPERLEEGLQRILDGQYEIEERTALAATFVNDQDYMPFAVNDIVVSRVSYTNIAEFEIYYGDRLIDRYAADGIIFSTPTGSTAYNLSAGGPVIDPSLGTILLTPICPHSIGTRPIIFSGEKTISLLCTSGDVQVQEDGRVPVLLKKGEMVAVGPSKLKAKFISFNEYEFFEVLTLKIKQKG